MRRAIGGCETHRRHTRATVDALDHDGRGPVGFADNKRVRRKLERARTELVVDDRQHRVGERERGRARAAEDGRVAELQADGLVGFREGILHNRDDKNLHDFTRTKNQRAVRRPVIEHRRRGAVGGRRVIDLRREIRRARANDRDGGFSADGVFVDAVGRGRESERHVIVENRQRRHAQFTETRAARGRVGVERKQHRAVAVGDVRVVENWNHEGLNRLGVREHEVRHATGWRDVIHRVGRRAVRDDDVHGN